MNKIQKKWKYALYFWGHETTKENNIKFMFLCSVGSILGPQKSQIIFLSVKEKDKDLKITREYWEQARNFQQPNEYLRRNIY